MSILAKGELSLATSFRYHPYLFRGDWKLGMALAIIFRTNARRGVFHRVLGKRRVKLALILFWCQISALQLGSSVLHGEE